MPDYDRMTRAQLLDTVRRLEAQYRELAGLEVVRLDLEAYQHEIEAQQHELQESRLLLETSRDSYAELYDFAPIPYFTLDRSGVVKEANLTACSLLQVERARLNG